MPCGVCHSDLNQSKMDNGRHPLSAVSRHEIKNGRKLDEIVLTVSPFCAKRAASWCGWIGWLSGYCNACRHGDFMLIVKIWQTPGISNDSGIVKYESCTVNCSQLLYG